MVETTNYVRNQGSFTSLIIKNIYYKINIRTSGPEMGRAPKWAPSRAATTKLTST